MPTHSIRLSLCSFFSPWTAGPGVGSLERWEAAVTPGSLGCRQYVLMFLSLVFGSALGESGVLPQPPPRLGRRVGHVGHVAAAQRRGWGLWGPAGAGCLPSAVLAERRQRQGGRRTAIAREALRFSFLPRGVSLPLAFQHSCRFPIPQEATRSLLSLPGAHEALLRCRGPSWQPEADGAASRSAGTVARGRQPAPAHPADNTEAAAPHHAFCPPARREEQLGLGTPIQLVPAARFCWKGTSSSALKILFIIPVPLSLRQRGLLFWPAHNTQAFCSRTKTPVLATVSISA